jgi:hypothetical protein
MRIPYGISNFADLRERGFVYVDKTSFIPRLEDATKGRHYLVFLRPRRMGKTLLVSMLEQYYDVLAAPKFDALFAGLAIAAAPTEERGRYAVLRLEMTGLTATAGADALRADFFARVEYDLQSFLRRYRALMPEAAAAFDEGRSTDSPALLLSRFLHAMQESPLKLYVIIDEYDNFTNDLIARGDHETYRAAVHTNGFVREFYKVLKWGTAVGVVRRILMTGVSPVTLDDLTSGFNIASNVTLDEDLNAMCGFTSEEVERIVGVVLGGGGYTLDPAAVVEDLRLYYDGYLFSRRASERMFNPDMVLMFAKEMSPPASYPEELLDLNVRTDYGRIRRLLLTPEGAVRVDVADLFRRVLAEGRVRARLKSSFSLDLLYEPGNFLSLLYYLGMLTLEERDGWTDLRIPNYAIRTLYWETVARMLDDALEVRVSASDADDAFEAMAREGDLAPFVRLVFTRVIRKLSNRDLIRLDEKTMKVVLLAYLALTEVFFAASEVELGFGYGDLVLLPSPIRPAAQVAFVIELKYLKAGATDEAVLAKLDEADAQLRRYLADEKLVAMAGGKPWKGVSVAFVGTEACWLRELGGEAERVGA